MSAYDAITLLALFGIVALVVCVAYAMRDADRQEPQTFADYVRMAEADMQRDPRPDSLIQGQYEAELDKPGHVPGSYTRP